MTGPGLAAPATGSPGPGQAWDPSAADPAPPHLTWLYAPGDRPEVVAGALASGADVVLVDLEDAVATERKGYALRATAELLAQPRPGPVPVHVRVNALDGPLAETEVRTLAALPGTAGLRLPKVHGPHEVLRVAEWVRQAREAAGPEGSLGPERTLGPEGVLGPEGAAGRGEEPAGGSDPAAGGDDPVAGAGAAAGGARAVRPQPPGLHPLLESAWGVEHAFAVATAHPTVHGIALGEADLRADLGVSGDEGLAWPRSRVVVAARAAGLPQPAQSVYPDVRDVEGLARSCARGRALGFLGRTAIHPRQLPVIERAYLPDQREVEAAEEVVRAAATDSGALALPDGRFVDAAVVAGARRTLALARRRG